MTIDTSKMVSAESLAGEDEEETEALNALARRARNYIGSFEWCERIDEILCGIGVPGVIGVFLVRIVPRAPGVDNQLWVIVGDVPPAYLVTDDAPDAGRALELYVGLMQQWVNAVKAGRDVTELIPVDAAPSTKTAEMLQSRLTFLSHRIVPEYRSTK
jgi:hypothetical protein